MGGSVLEVVGWLWGIVGQSHMLFGGCDGYGRALVLVPGQSQMVFVGLGVHPCRALFGRPGGRGPKGVSRGGSPGVPAIVPTIFLIELRHKLRGTLVGTPPGTITGHASKNTGRSSGHVSSEIRGAIVGTPW